MRAYTIQGLCLYLDCNVGYFNDFEVSLKGKTDDISKDFSAVITRMRETIYNQKFSGAAADLLNANIIARDLGLSDRKDVTTGGDKLTPVKGIDLSNATPEELKAIAKITGITKED